MGKQRKRQRRAKVFEAQRGRDRPRCAYCGAAMSRKVGVPGSPPVMMGGELTYPFTQDHIVPRSKGGPRIEANLAPACGPCNGTRGDMPLPAFIIQLGNRAVMTVRDAIELERKAKAACRMI